MKMWNRHFEVIRGKAEKAIFDEIVTRKVSELLKDIDT